MQYTTINFGANILKSIGSILLKISRLIMVVVVVVMMIIPLFSFVNFLLQFFFNLTFSVLKLPHM